MSKLLKDTQISAAGNCSGDNIPKGGEQLKFMWTEQEGGLGKLTGYRLLRLFYKTDKKFSFLKQYNPGPLQGMHAGGKCLFRSDPKKFVMTDYVHIREHAHVLLKKN